MFKRRIQRLEALVDRCDSETAPARRLQTAQDIVDLLEEQVEALRAASWVGTLQKAQAIAVLDSIARKAIEVKNLAARIEMLETVLKCREEGSPR
jgi:hypothetical protein